MCKNYSSVLGYNEIIFDASKLVSGVYTLSLSNNSESVIERIIIQ